MAVLGVADVQDGLFKVMFSIDALPVASFGPYGSIAKFRPVFA
jgi:hypothetical protein